ncbi:MAG: tRNA uridine-5-carboxymethylaminomethyl(34) synthesis GTPase MnmE [Alphaproteobacteria bacterium]|nr:tRNA uridine-5-carboxymethylaminomethyl(34) synthesis GTPase MnmE [Alphaproteobacteria bacterium]MBV9692084.1 tRNA uridine-5-carboxymethylaminomethyl(34) synthesis GTPase MnmE [Alphaproteobacteria bacterium]
MAAETIYALSSAPGRAGIAVVRISGPQAMRTAAALTGKPLPPPRRAAVRRFVDAQGSPIDDGLLLLFPGPQSFTGEDVVELHVHGGAAILEALFRVLAGLGLRAARAGEFTRRAVESGRLELTRAEAIADLIDAETEAQRLQALGQYGGNIAETCESWRDRLLRASAAAEAAIDFSDEELPADLLTGARRETEQILQEIQRYLDDSHRGERIREGLSLAVIGPPNAGKSSLVNALAKRDVAIVSPHPGTTRDVIEVRLDLGGYAVTVADTAGLRDVSDAVEAEGVCRAIERARSADLVVLLRDGSSNREDGFESENFRADLLVWNKFDLPWPGERDGICISSKSGQGLEQLIAKLTQLISDRLGETTQSPVLTRRRHRDALEEAACSLRLALLAPSDRPELLAEGLRLALREIGRITGRVDLEAMLDIVFRDFCIGK